MINLIVNNQNVSSKEDKKLMDFLRYDLRYTSVKDGCSAGACGACMVIIDGKAMRACLPMLSKLEGKSVTTVEGLSPREKEVYSYAFGICGAVQCGFCIPAMVISAKALIDINNDPTREDVKKAIRSNICRCTGYAKIEDAILLAAKYIREGLEIVWPNSTGELGEDFIRVDAIAKTLGTGIYVDDIHLDGMLYGKVLRPEHPRILVKAIDITKAKAHEDCVDIFTAQDVPGSNKHGHLIKDWDVFIPVGAETRYVGDALALVITNSKETLDEVLKLIEVEYEELKPITSPAEGMKEDAPKLHEGGNVLRKEVLKRGNAEKALENSKHIVKKYYKTPFTDHAFMEPECAIAEPDGENGIILYTGAQSIYDEQREISAILGIPPEKVHVKSQLVGGGFGGKEDMSVQHHAALAAWLLKKPVKIKFSRQESLDFHTKRHAMDVDLTVGCDENGILTGMTAKVISDCGAYASLGGPVLQRACTHAAGPYNYQNMHVEGYCIYTNNPPGGAFRGFGVTQTAFAMECSLNLLAQKVGISPWEIRYRNAIRPGQVLPNGQIADDSTSLVECLEKVKDVYENNKYAGIATSFKNAGLGVGVPDTGRCTISVENGMIHVRTSAACIGQGMATVCTQIVCQTTKLNPDLIIIESPDTKRTPDSGTTTASRQTLFTGEATAKAARKLKQELDSGKNLQDLEGREYYGEYTGITDPMGSDKENPISHIAYGFAAQVVILNEQGKVEKVVAAYDAGKIVNPKLAQGQVEGGIVMGLGYALTEDYVLQDSVPKTKYGTLGLWRATETPPIEVVFSQERQQGDGKDKVAYGAKGIGELATIPTAPAVQAAYYKFDGIFRDKLPLEKTAYKK